MDRCFDRLLKLQDTIEKDGKIIGILRYNLFWDNVPFCTLLYIDGGCGRQLMEHWEREMKAAGCKMVMTSTQVDENAQHFYRKIGYKDSCGFLSMLRAVNSRWK